MFYLDASAAAKLVVAERGSEALAKWLRSTDATVFSSDLLRTELLRAIRRHVPEMIDHGRLVLDSITMISLPRNVYEWAATLGQPDLRSLDAIHLAAAMEVGGDDLEGIITYDSRMTQAALSLNIEVVAPT